MAERSDLPPALRSIDIRRGAEHPAQEDPRVPDACVFCGSARLTAIDLTLNDGTLVGMANCRDCENRSWWSDGARLSLQEVVDRTTTAKGQTIDLANRRTRRANR